MKVADITSQSYEAKLVEKLRSGDSTAMEEFYNLYRSRLYTLILEQVDRDQALAEDLVHWINSVVTASFIPGCAVSHFTR
jgi:hypothetical protein